MCSLESTAVFPVNKGSKTDQAENFILISRLNVNLQTEPGTMKDLGVFLPQ
jgi:hypothetical protein